MVMSETGFLSETDRAYLRRYINKRKAPGLEVRRANALLALDKGYRLEAVCDFLELGETTLRSWRTAYQDHGISFLKMKDYSPRKGHLTQAQEADLRTFLRDTPMRHTHEVRAHIRQIYKRDYSRSGCIKMLHRLDFKYTKPARLPAQSDEEVQQAFIDTYDALQTNLPEDEAIYFGDAAHPEHQAKPAHGWFHKEDTPAIQTNSGRKRVNIHGALNLETFDMPFVDVETVDRDSTIALLKHIEARNPDKRVIHVILDNAPYHHARDVRDWLGREGCRIKIHWLPPYAPHLNPIERLWGVMHKYVTHNRFYKTFRAFGEAIVAFLKETLPKDWKEFRDTVTDNFRIISAKGCNMIA